MATALAGMLMAVYCLLVIVPIPVSAGTNVWSTSGPANPYVRAIGVSPNYANDTTVLAGTWEGVHISNNGGATWVTTDLTDTLIMSFAFSPHYATDGTVYTGTWDGLYKSTNNGVTWTRVDSALNDASIGAIAIAPDGTMYAGTWEGLGDLKGIYRSSDGGATWHQTNVGLAEFFILSLAISPQFASDSTIYAGTWSGMYKSTNDGDSWQLAGLADIAVDSIAYGPGNAIFTATDAGIYKSTTSGATWIRVDTFPLTTAMSSVTVGPDGTVYAATSSNGVLKSSDGGMTWMPINDGLTNLAVTTVASSRDNTLFAGTTGNGLFSLTIPAGGGGGGGGGGSGGGIPQDDKTPATPPKAQTTFADIPAGAWYKSVVETLVAKGIINGYIDGSFKPHATVTRAEFAKMICVAMNWQVQSVRDSSFSDLDNGHWAHGYIETAKLKGAISGYKNGTFRPENNISRAEIATVIATVLDLGSTPSTLKDIDAHWAHNAIDACVQANIINGYTDSTFRPNSTATRAEAAKMISGMVD